MGVGVKQARKICIADLGLLWVVFTLESQEYLLKKRVTSWGQIGIRESECCHIGVRN